MIDSSSYDSSTFIPLKTFNLEYFIKSYKKFLSSSTLSSSSSSSTSSSSSSSSSLLHEELEMINTCLEMFTTKYHTYNWGGKNDKLHFTSEDMKNKMKSFLEQLKEEISYQSMNI